MTIMKTVSATVPADVKVEAMALAKAHGTTMTALVREMLVRIAAGDKEALAWIEKARNEYSQQANRGDTTR